MAFDPARQNTVRLVNYTSKLVVTITGANTIVAALMVTAYQPGGLE